VTIITIVESGNRPGEFVLKGVVASLTALHP
jgi:hypothetical protein